MKLYWADEVAEKILARKKDEYILSTGITPSGPYHMGHLREMIVTDAVKRALEERGVNVRFTYFIDDLDNLRKLYPFLPKDFEKYVNCPVIKIPSPDGSGISYADYFLNPFKKALKELGIEVEFLYAHEFYESGKMTEQISTALKNRDAIAEILTRVSKRELPEGWQPFEPLDETTGKIRGAKIVSTDIEGHKIEYEAQDGTKKWADYSKGQGKLPWRVDWPARWALLGVDFEPFGKEHAAAGGSYDVGKEIVKKIYGCEAPEYVVYEHIYLKGEAKKMSASLGNLVGLDQFLSIVPPEVARYFVLRSKNDRHLVFDPGQGLMQLTDEFARLEEEVAKGEADLTKQAMHKYSQISGKRVMVKVPFSHLVTVYQAAQGDFEEIKRLLMHTGHIAAVESERDLKQQIEKVANWLKLYAPEDLKFSVQKEAPKVELSAEQKKVLEIVSAAVEEGQRDIDLHNSIYDAGKASGLPPRDTFKLIYRIFLDKDSGPKAGFFLSLLEKDFVLKRLQHYL